MVPHGFIFAAVLVATAAVAAWSFWWSTKTVRAFAVSAIGAPLLSLALVPLFIGSVVFALGEGLADSLETAIVIGGICGLISTVPSLVTGTIAGSLARGISLWLVPERRKHESLAQMSRRLGGVMNLRRALVAIFAATLLFAVVGCGIGLSLGIFVPGYYRDQFRNGHSPHFDPVSMGIGLGLSQGAAGGAVIGLLIVAILAWYDLRRQALNARSTAA